MIDPQASVAASHHRLKFGRWLRLFGYTLLGGFLFMAAVDIATMYWSKAKIYYHIEQLPKREYAVVLGTAKFYPSGKPNLYYRHRIEAAQQIMGRQKADYLLLSGDNRTPHYNEPKMMTADLVKLGISSERLKQDYAGYSTLDSVLRAKQTFQLPPFTLVSQAFHCERALVIAAFHDIDAICFAAEYPKAHYKVRIREFFARTAMLFSLLFGIQLD